MHTKDIERMCTERKPNPRAEENSMNQTIDPIKQEMSKRPKNPQVNSCFIRVEKKLLEMNRN